MNGVIVINKPQEFTSFDVVAVMRKITGERKIGHCGTLDPNATGVLPLLLGRAAKAQDILPNHDKAYTATFKLGLVTDTLDIWGEVISEETTSVKKEELLAIIPEFTGRILQIPPMYSAVKKDGKRLYDLARQGIEVEREAREITVYSLNLLEFDEDKQEGKIEVSCSKGTYIRTLIDDMAKRLCSGGCMTSLERTSACGYTLQNAFTLEELKELREKGEIESVILSTESLFETYKEVAVSEAQAKRFANGGALGVERLRNMPTLADGEICRVVHREKNFWALGILSEEKGELRVYKQFCDYSEVN